jgi:hypothetical protein
MLLRLRLWVSDRPGALGQVTRELGGCGADIVQVSVLGRERGRALDEITVFLPESGLRDRLERSLRGMAAVSVEGVRACGEVPGAFPDLNLLGRVAAEPRSTLDILVDALPRILAADWALALCQSAGQPLGQSLGQPIGRPVAGASATAKGLIGVVTGAPAGASAEPVEAEPASAPEILARSWGAPDTADLPGLPTAPVALSTGSTRYAVAPVVPAGEAGPGPVGPGTPQILLCRIGDPAFHRFEVMRLARLCEVAAAIAGSRLVPARVGTGVRQLTPP